MQLFRRRAVLVPTLLALSGLIVMAAFWGVRQVRISRAHQIVAPQIVKLVEQHRYNAADQQVRQIEALVPNEPAVRNFQRDYRLITSVETTPPGAEIAIKDYATPDAPWRVLGKGPLQKITIPLGYFRWRVTAPGYLTREFAETGVLQPIIRFALYPAAGSPTDMVLVPAGLTYGRKPV